MWVIDAELDKASLLPHTLPLLYFVFASGGASFRLHSKARFFERLVEDGLVGRWAPEARQAAHRLRVWLCASVAIRYATKA